MSLLVERRKLDHFQHKLKPRKGQQKTYQSNFELTSRENVDSIGVIASSAVCRMKNDFSQIREILCQCLNCHEDN